MVTFPARGRRRLFTSHAPHSFPQVVMPSASDAPRLGAFDGQHAIAAERRAVTVRITAPMPEARIRCVDRSSPGTSSAAAIDRPRAVKRDGRMDTSSRYAIRCSSTWRGRDNKLDRKIDYAFVSSAQRRLWPWCGLAKSARRFGAGARENRTHVDVVPGDAGTDCAQSPRHRRCRS